MRVVVATDGSESSGTALELAASMEWPAGSEIRVATVIEPLEPVMYTAWLAADPDTRSYDEATSRDARAVVESGIQHLARTAAHVTPSILRGRAASEIVAEARAFRADVIILGSRGHGTIASAV